MKRVVAVLQSRNHVFDDSSIRHRDVTIAVDNLPHDRMDAKPIEIGDKPTSGVEQKPTESAEDKTAQNAAHEAAAGKSNSRTEELNTVENTDETEITRDYVVISMGGTELESVTSTMSTWRSNQLS